MAMYVITRSILILYDGLSITKPTSKVVFFICLKTMQTIYIHEVKSNVLTAILLPQTMHMSIECIQ